MGNKLEKQLYDYDVSKLHPTLNEVPLCPSPVPASFLRLVFNFLPLPFLIRSCSCLYMPLRLQMALSPDMARTAL